jgi:hypothetical protein
VFLPTLARAQSDETTTPSSTATVHAEVTTAPPPTRETDPDADKKKDKGRGLEWFYLTADGGFSYVNMASVSSSKLAVQNASSDGPAFGVGAGVRLFFLQLGAQANLNALSSFNLWQLDAVLGFHIPLGHLEPYIGFHGGYCFVGSLDDGLSTTGGPSITGGDAGLQVGLDYYFNHFVSLGVEGAGNLLFLHGSPPPLPAGVDANMLTSQQKTVYDESGDSVGLGLSVTLHLGFHL